MKLKAYMDANGKSVAEMAGAIGCSKAMVYLALKGKKGFGKSNMRRIVEITGGKVTLEELMPEGDAA